MKRVSILFLQKAEDVPADFGQHITTIHENVKALVKWQDGRHTKFCRKLGIGLMGRNVMITNYPY